MRLPHTQPASDMPYICKSLTPYISSNCNHCLAVSGAVEQLISLQVGKCFTSAPLPPPPAGGRSTRASGPGGGGGRAATPSLPSPASGAGTGRGVLSVAAPSP